LAFLDADDFWSPYKIGIQLLALERYPDAALCWCDAIIANESEWHDQWQSHHYRLEQSQDTDFSSTARQVSFEEIFAKPYLGTPNVMLSKQRFDAIGGFDTSLRKAEDVDLWLRACHQQHCVHVPLALTCVIQQTQSLSRSEGGSPFAFHELALQRFLAAHPAFQSGKSRIVKRAFSDLYQHWGSELLGNGSPTVARQMLGRSLRYQLSLRSAYLFMKAVARSLQAH
jgi:hypothetical protein